MGYRRTLRNMWVPKRQASDEDVPEEDDEDVDVEAEAEAEEIDAEAMEFDVDADLADDPPIIPSPTRVPDPTSSFDTRFTAFEERMTAMHERRRSSFRRVLLLCKRSRGSSLRR
ncbi:hypothetical protein CJ030_MR7G013006 [Morella rubra]|uniref:Uncharacterized protein n=1 Tax=Morella rubra TaxID=262757 RepID=A0A6A1V8I7_9ROSI|nr:hypothetical protein CJ030_MR7G013006 [Morella rubra]